MRRVISVLFGQLVGEVEPMLLFGKLVNTEDLFVYGTNYHDSTIYTIWTTLPPM